MSIEREDQRSRRFLFIFAIVAAALAYQHSATGGMGAPVVGALLGISWAAGVIATFTPSAYLGYLERTRGLTGWTAALSPLGFALMAFLLVKLGFALGFLIDRGFWDSLWGPAAIFNVVGNLRTTNLHFSRSRLFRRNTGGDNPRPQMPFPTTGNFIDIGVLTDMRRDLLDRGNRILDSLGRGGTLAMMIVQEPYPGDWGSTPREHRESAVKALMAQVDMYEAEPHEHELVLGGEEGMQKLRDSAIFKDCQQDAQRINLAAESGRARFLLGTLSNRCKVVAVLMLQ